MLVGMVDVVFADVAQRDQARIVGLNAHLFLKVGGGVLVSIKANCIDSTAKPEVVFANEVQKMRTERIKPQEQLTLGKAAGWTLPESSFANPNVQSRSNAITVSWQAPTHAWHEMLGSKLRSGVFMDRLTQDTRMANLGALKWRTRWSN